MFVDGKRGPIRWSGISLCQHNRRRITGTHGFRPPACAPWRRIANLPHVQSHSGSLVEEDICRERHALRILNRDTDVQRRCV